MYTPDGLKEFHRRAHHSLKGIINHCMSLSKDELNRKLEGFGYETVHLQLHHSIGAEKYWISVVKGRMDVDMDEKDYPTAESLEQFRLEVFNITQEYLSGASPEELATARPMMTWGNKEKVLIPAHILMRTVTHIFQHNGQVAAMCRLFGKPIPAGLDFPILENY